MEKLDEMQGIFEKEGLTFEVRGLDEMQPLANSSLSTRKKVPAALRRFVLTCDESASVAIIGDLAALGVGQFTKVPCEVSSFDESSQRYETQSRVRLEFIVTQHVAKQLTRHFREKLLPMYDAEVCVEHIDRLQADMAISLRPATSAMQEDYASVN